MLIITAAETTSPEAFRALSGKLYKEAKRLATEEAETSDDPRLAGVEPRDMVSTLTERLFRHVDGHSVSVDPRVFSVLDEGADEGLLVAYDDPEDVQPILTDEHTTPAPSTADELRDQAAADAGPDEADEDRTDDGEEPDDDGTAGDGDEGDGEGQTPEVIPPTVETVDPSDKGRFPNIGTLEQFMDQHEPPISRTGLSTRPDLEQAVRDYFAPTPAGDAG